MKKKSDSQKKLVLVEQFFYPDGWSGTELPRDVTVYLSNSGYDVEVLCGSDQYVPVDIDRGTNPLQSGVRIRRLPKLLWNKNIKKNKFVRQALFYLLAFPLLLFRRSPHVFIAQTNPPLMIVLVRIAALLHRRPYILIAMDLYPEVLFSNNSVRKTSAIGRLLTVLFSWAYRGASSVVALGPTMKYRLQSKGVETAKIRVISNWATGDISIVRGKKNSLLHEWGLTGFDIILYSGNLGIAHDIRSPILAFNLALEKNPSFRLVFIGQGSRYKEARDLVAELGLSDYVFFKPLVPIDMLPESLGIATLALVTLGPGFEGLVVPSKLLGYMARGVPTIYIGPKSDAQTLLQASGGGMAFGNADYSKIADFMVYAANDPIYLQEVSRSASEYYARCLAKEIGLEEYRELIDSVVPKVSG